MACYRRGKAKPHEAGDHEAGDSSVPRRRPGAVSQKTDCKMQFWLVANDNTQPDGQWRVKWCENRASISHILLGRLTIELTSNIMGGKVQRQIGRAFSLMRNLRRHQPAFQGLNLGPQARPLILMPMTVLDFLHRRGNTVGPAVARYMTIQTISR
ncbi:hypothetical protein E4U11_007025 [Claviceps purpurea]|nr:hypothetical protein E4U11_007025 [Claviceps purpurea]